MPFFLVIKLYNNFLLQGLFNFFHSVGSKVSNSLTHHKKQSKRWDYTTGETEWYLWKTI